MKRQWILNDGPKIPFGADIIIGVVEQMQKEARKPKIQAAIRRYDVNHIDLYQLQSAGRKLLVSVDEDEGATFTPSELFALHAYIMRIELEQRGELYGDGK